MANREADHSHVCSSRVKTGVNVPLILHMPSQHAHGQLYFTVYSDMMALVQGFFTACNEVGKVRGQQE